MQGLEFVDVPGWYIFASGAGLMGTLLLLTIGWRKRDKAALERFRSARHEIEAVAHDFEVDVHVEPEEVSGTRDIKQAWKGGMLEPNLDDEPTKPVIYTSADKALCSGKLTVRPVRKHSAA